MSKFLTAVAAFLLSYASAQADLAVMSLQQVYSLPQEQVEKIVWDADRDACADLISSYTQGKNDPAKLSPAQFCAVQNYSSSRYMVSAGLWAADPTKVLNGTDWAYVRVLDSALEKIKNEPPTLVYRGTSRKSLAFTKPGEIVRLKGYVSTSPNRESAEGFIRDRLMVIKAISGKNIKPYSNAGGEDEFLLARSTLVRFERSEVVTMELFTDEGPEDREVEIVYLTEIPKK